MRRGLEGGPMAGALLAAAPDAVVVVDTEGRIMACNPAVHSLLGYDPQELIGEPVEVLVPLEARPSHTGFREKFLAAPTARPMGAGLRLTARCKDGTDVPVDISLAPISGDDGERFVGAFMRDASERDRTEDRLRAIIEINQAVLIGEQLEDSLEVAADHARRLLAGDDAWVVESTGDRIEVRAGRGDIAEGLVGSTFPASGTLASTASTRGEPVLVEDLSSSGLGSDMARQLDIGPVVVVPIADRGRDFGSLIVTRHRGRHPFDSVDRRVAEVFAGAIAVSFTLGEVRLAAEQAGMLEEHDRIARDLHDTVIQRVFAIGMSLQSVAGLATGPVAERISDAVDQLDVTIREVRDAIFHLQTRFAAPAGFRHRLRQLVGELTAAHDLTVRYAFDGPVDATIDAGLAEQLLALIREAVSNALRHARATRVEVIVVVTDDLRLSVLDDGVGIPTQPSAGAGLRNMTERAHRLGGELSVRRREPSGTIVECHLPAGALADPQAETPTP